MHAGSSCRRKFFLYGLYKLDPYLTATLGETVDLRSTFIALFVFEIQSLALWYRGEGV